jgi:transcriptional regulator with XRE-family HTH domain
MAERPIFSADLGAYFRAFRERKGWNQRQTADIAERRGLPDLTYNTLRYLEEGKTKNPDPDVLKAVSALYDVPYETLVAECIRAQYGVTMHPVAQDDTSQHEESGQEQDRDPSRHTGETKSNPNTGGTTDEAHTPETGLLERDADRRQRIVKLATEILRLARTDHAEDAETEPRVAGNPRPARSRRR